MSPFQITIFTRDGCCLCDDVKERVQRVAEDYPIELQMFDITTDEEIYELYKWTIPVVHINGEEVFVSKMAELWLRRELDLRMEKEK
ncbi:glutaredoxin family protein [Ammoniphilus sp. CFH 90114]|uniref:glutaredoxin family protein n=1 Tax=Ammoniphilus sp. CFH 90114 TaxID=2493665 RepID=UPI00100E0E43|nr:glutaredoxin family protein [Ammoniphilus sp. CFH 90114]RXT04042.1 glutaredoxin family protein [Ammoniphilus sp. CFH 90114]